MHTFAPNLRRWIRVAATLGLALGALAITPLPGMPSPAVAAEAIAGLDADGLAANKTWWGALVAGTVPAVDAVLAPEFQITRADGTAYDKKGYLAKGLPHVVAMPEFSQMVVTQHDDLLVTRYYVTVQETRDGKTVQKHAPRLTVFRKVGDNWLVVAHANFATLEE